MSRVKSTAAETVTSVKPLRGQMDIFNYIEKPRGYVANERSVKKRRSTVPGQINMFEYMDLREEKLEADRQAAILAAEQQELPGQMDIMEYLSEIPMGAMSVEAEESEQEAEFLPDESAELARMEQIFGAKQQETAADDPSTCDSEDPGSVNLDDEDLLILSEGTVNIGRIMRVMHISAMEAELVRQRLADMA